MTIHSWLTAETYPKPENKLGSEQVSNGWVSNGRVSQKRLSTSQIQEYIVINIDIFNVK